MTKADRHTQHRSAQEANAQPQPHPPRRTHISVWSGSLVLVCGLFCAVACVTPTETEVRPWHKMGKGNAGAAPTSVAPTSAPTPAPLPPVKPLAPSVDLSKPAPVAVPVATTSASIPTPGAVGPRISKSLGARGGYVVLWPRIIPSNGAEGQQALAQELQRRMSAVVNRAAGAKPVDVRPAPERACPKGTGCVGTAVGVLLLHHSRGCAAVAMVTPPGPVQTKLSTIAGTLSLKADTIPFRDYPESQVTVRDFVPCDQLLQQVSNAEADLERMIRTASAAAQPR